MMMCVILAAELRTRNLHYPSVPESATIAVLA